MIHPQDRQLYLSEEELLRLPYLRKTSYLGSYPGRFHPEKKRFRHQALIAATVWYRRGSCWVADVFWLRDYDPPFSYEFYPGGPEHPGKALGERPTEAVPPEEAVFPEDVLAALSR